MLISELTYPSPADLDGMPERVVQDLLVYKNVKQVAEYGGIYDP